MDIALIRKIDKSIIAFLCIFFGLFVKIFARRKFDKSKVKKILVIKLWALGDSVISLVLINQIRKKFPKAQVDVLVQDRNKDVYWGNKDINNTHILGFFKFIKLFRRYDLCFDTEPYLNISALIAFFLSRYRVGFAEQTRSILYHKTVKFKRTQHMVQNYLDKLRVLGFDVDADKLVKIQMPKPYKENVERLLKSYGIKPRDYIVGITPGVAETVKSRMWPIERMAELADKILDKYKVKIIFVDSPGNKVFVEKIMSMMKHKDNVYNLAGQTKVTESFYLIEKCSIFISNDTGPMHVAASQGVKTIGLFGPNTPKLWGPYGKKNIALYHKVQCSPCILNEKGIFPECIYNGTKLYQQCMKK
ncbi:glycosyltransferase family 9 protein, partial [Candidatus Woesearchaeota archaeon]|nr:glycosyltransferase family 9 protein [Candidatus Woesearchaeota archaeon]